MIGLEGQKRVIGLRWRGRAGQRRRDNVHDLCFRAILVLFLFLFLVLMMTLSEELRDRRETETLRDGANYFHRSRQQVVEEHDCIRLSNLAFTSGSNVCL